MKLINAIWEKRNLGVDCIEMHCEERDDVAEVLANLPLRADYQVVRIPTGRADLMVAVQDKGYHLIEMQIRLVRCGRDFALPPLYKRFEPDLSFREATPDEGEKVAATMETGDIFRTDRISLDPWFAKGQAGRRYACWTRDLLRNGGRMSLVSLKGREVGFGVVMAKPDGRYDSCLGGIFSGWENRGMGFIHVFVNTAVPFKNGARTVVGHVSSNNLPALRLHLAFGYEVQAMEYVLIRHATGRPA